MKKALILSVTAGQGHNSVARALEQYYTSVGVECKVLDTIGYLNKLLGTSVDRGYLLSINKFKSIYSGWYEMLNKRRRSKSDMAPTRMMYHVFAGKLHKYVEDYAPDIIISTHPVPGVIMDILRRQGKLPQVTAGIVTDYTVLPYWEECLRLDYVVSANELMYPQLVKKGFRDSQILPTGIPVAAKFLSSRPAAEVREKFGLDPGKFTVMLMGGGMGYGDLPDSVRRLDALDFDMQFICVCGSNAGAKREIDLMKLTKPIANFGFVDFVDELMDASDCIVSKPSGISTSEALAKRLPIILVNPIPGQEIRNRHFLLNAGVAIAAGPLCPLEDAIYQLLRFPERVDNIRRNIELLRRPDAAKDLCEFMLKA